MKIQFTTSVAGARFAYRNKQIVDLRSDLAKEFLRARQAVRVEEEPAGLAALVPGLRKTRRGGKRAELAVGGTPETRG